MQWVCFTTYCDWFKKVTLIYGPIKRKNSSQSRHLLALVCHWNSSLWFLLLCQLVVEFAEILFFYAQSKTTKNLKHVVLSFHSRVVLPPKEINFTTSSPVSLFLFIYTLTNFCLHIFTYILNSNHFSLLKYWLTRWNFTKPLWFFITDVQLL